MSVEDEMVAAVDNRQAELEHVPRGPYRIPMWPLVFAIGQLVFAYIVVLLLIKSARADAPVQYEFTGFVDYVEPHNGQLVTMWGVDILGEPLLGSFMVDHTMAEQSNDPRGEQANYLDAILDFEYTIGDRVRLAMDRPAELSFMDQPHMDSVRFGIGLQVYLDDVVVDSVQADFILFDRASEMLNSPSISQTLSLGTDEIVNFVSTMFSADEYPEEWDDAVHVTMELLTLDVVLNERPTGWLTGDADLNGRVDAADLNALALNWRQEGNWIDGDFTGDGWVDAADLNELALNWRQPVSMAAAVPEPAVNMFVAFLIFLLGLIWVLMESGR